MVVTDTSMSERTSPLRACPGCGGGMPPLLVPYAPSRPLEVNACEPCRALWFDTGEHIRLGADGALALIRHLAAQPRCPAAASVRSSRAPSAGASSHKR